MRGVGYLYSAPLALVAQRTEQSPPKACALVRSQLRARICKYGKDEMNEEIKVNVGCGEFPAEGWINVDMIKEDDGPQPDVVATADDLPFEDNSVDKLYAGHVLEHIDKDDIPVVLDEFKRVLKEDGVAVIVGPDLTKAELFYPEMIHDIRDGAGRWAGDVHLWESRESTMYRILLDNDWVATPYPIESESLNEWPVTARVPWQFAFGAIPAQNIEKLSTTEEEPLEGTVL